jgi:hypothetical protein
MSREIISQWNKWYQKALKRYYLHNAATRWYHHKSVALGFWITNILEDGRFAFGNIHLKPEVSQSE